MTQKREYFPWNEIKVQLVKLYEETKILTNVNILNTMKSICNLPKPFLKMIVQYYSIENEDVLWCNFLTTFFLNLIKGEDIEEDSPN